MTAIEFIESLSTKVNPDALTGLSSIFHFDISGPNGGQKTVKVADGKIEILDGLVEEAKCKVTTSDDLLLKLINKQENPMMAFMMGKIKVSNPGELMNYAKIFGLM